MISKSRLTAVSLTDWAALVGGAALASVHFRRIDFVADRNLYYWAPTWILFAFVSTTASGPLVLAGRLLQPRRYAHYPQLGDFFWAILGVPWVLAALAKVCLTGFSSLKNAADELYILLLACAIALCCLVVLGLIWVRWVRAPRVPLETASEASNRSWTNKVGFVLAVAWPVQCGAGLFVASG